MKLRNIEPQLIPFKDLIKPLNNLKEWLLKLKIIYS
jgi:hypothetical protein